MARDRDDGRRGGRRDDKKGTPKGGREGTPTRRRTTMDGPMEARGDTRRSGTMWGTSGRMDRRP